MDYNEALTFITGFSGSGAPQTDISRFEKLCARLGDPQKKLRFIHIAGTNGKGSTCAYIDEALRAAGIVTGCFTSPYIIDLRERIRLNGGNISESGLADCCAEVKAALDPNEGYSQFEIFTACAFLHYVREQAEFVVLETGIGGLYDCTNIVTPEVSVITRIDYDHTALLGTTIREIAAHKAGIIKAGVPAVSSPFQHPEALEVLRGKAAAVNSPFVEAEGFTIAENSLYGTEFTYKGERFRTGMGGAHQPENAAAAVEALRLLGIPESAIHYGSENAKLPARMQVVRREPLMIVDGGHNASGALAAARLLKAEELRPVMLLGMLDTKDWRGSLENLLGQASSAVFVDGFHPRAVPSEELFAFANERFDIPASAVRGIAAALEAVNSRGEPVFAGGSLYLAGEILRALSADNKE